MKKWPNASFQITFFLILLLHFSRNAFSIESIDSDNNFEDASWEKSEDEKSSLYQTSESVRSKFVHGSESTSFEFEFEHAFGSSSFLPAGNFSSRFVTNTRGDFVLLNLLIKRNPFSAVDLKRLRDLLLNDGFYRIRIPTSFIQNSKNKITSSLKAKCLFQSNFHEVFTMFTDASGNFLAFSYSSNNECLENEIDNFENYQHITQVEFVSKIELKKNEIVSRLIPSSESLGQSEADTSVEQSMDGEEKKLPEKTFFQKYWMYIIMMGLLLMNTMLNAPPEPNARPGGPTNGPNVQRSLNAAPNGGPRRRR